MIKILLCGCNGVMGKVVSNIIKDTPDMVVAAGIDPHSGEKRDFPVFKTFKECDIKCDVIIDFSHPSVTMDLIDYALSTSTPAVICTTGISDDQNKRIEEASKSVAIFKSGNMSLGINLIMKLIRKAAEVLHDSFDIEIIEKHHNRKLDAPSGTAYMLARAIEESIPYKTDYNFGRHGTSAKRNANEIGIHAIRGGTIVGEHSVIFAGPDELIEIKHTALSRNIFAYGALKAAKFIITKDKGLYSMDDIIK